MVRVLNVRCSLCGGTSEIPGDFYSPQTRSAVINICWECVDRLKEESSRKELEARGKLSSKKRCRVCDVIGREGGQDEFASISCKPAVNLCWPCIGMAFASSSLRKARIADQAASAQSPRQRVYAGGTTRSKGYF